MVPLSRVPAACQSGNVHVAQAKDALAKRTGACCPLATGGSEAAPVKQQDVDLDAKESVGDLFIQSTVRNVQ